MYSLASGTETFRLWIYIVAERLDWYVILAAIFFVLLHGHKRRNAGPELISRSALIEGAYSVAGILLAWGISYILKITLALPRPFLKFPEVVPIFLHGGFNSFPSGHATLFAALGVAIYLNHKKAGIFFMIAAFLIGFARVVAGVHFPIDILAGWFLGGFISWLSYKYLIRHHR